MSGPISFCAQLLEARRDGNAATDNGLSPCAWWFLPPPGCHGSRHDVL